MTVQGTLRRLYLLSLRLRGIAARVDPSAGLSDNQVYPYVCTQASRHDRWFRGFRRNPAYTAILEHVSEEQGQRYLDLVMTDPDIARAIERFKENDRYGNPWLFEYASIGRISPTTLRYIKVLSELKALFGTLDGFDICEVGVGYGGQCRIIASYFKPASYVLVDIKPALMLARRFLEAYAVDSTLMYETMDELPTRRYDLVISNYAFTELPRRLQDVYLEKVVLNSARGYITYNELTPPEFESYKRDDLLQMIPGAERRDETPLTHPRNSLIVWGHRRLAHSIAAARDVSPTAAVRWR